MKLSDTLDTLALGERNFGSLTTTNQCTRRDVMVAVDKGYAESIGMVDQCDGDGGYIEGRQSREGFKLTESGKAFHSENSKAPMRCYGCGASFHLESLNTVDIENYGEHGTIEVCDECYSENSREDS